MLLIGLVWSGAAVSGTDPEGDWDNFFPCGSRDACGAEPRISWNGGATVPHSELRGYTTEPSPLVAVDLNDVTKVVSYAFSLCENLERVNFGPGLVEIGGNAFSRCPKLTTVTASYSSTPQSGGGAAYGAVFPSSIREIMSYAFWQTGFESVFLPGRTADGGGLDTINCAVFSENDNLERVFIGDGVTSLAMGSFEQCENLRSLRLAGTVTEIDNNAAFRLTSPGTGGACADDALYSVPSGSNARTFCECDTENTACFSVAADENPGDPGGGDDDTGAGGDGTGTGDTGGGEDGTDDGGAPDLSLPTAACLGLDTFDNENTYTHSILGDVEYCCSDAGSLSDPNPNCYEHDDPFRFCAVATENLPCCFREPSLQQHIRPVGCFSPNTPGATGAAACYENQQLADGTSRRYCANYPRIKALLDRIAVHLREITTIDDPVADFVDLTDDDPHMAAGWVGTVIGQMIVKQKASDAVRLRGHRLVLTLAPDGDAIPGRRRRNADLQAKDCLPAPDNVDGDGGDHFTDDTDVVAVTNAGTGVTLGVFYCPCNVELPPDSAVIEYVRHGTCFRTAAAEDDADNGGGGGSSDGSSDGGGGLSDGEVAGIVVGGVAGAVVVGLGIQRLIRRRGYSNVPLTEEGVPVPSGGGAMVY